MRTSVHCSERRSLTWVGLTVLGVSALLLIPIALGTTGGTASTRGAPTRLGPTPAAVSLGSHVTVVNSSADDWPELHRAPNLTGYVPNSPLSSTNAGTLGVGWATDLYGPALDSPVVAYDAALGETLAYIGTDNGNVLGINVATGQIVWGDWIGAAVRSTPLVNNGSLYIATYTTDTVYKFNATTGAVDCSLVNSDPFEATPTFATPPGGVPTLFLGGLDVGRSAAFLAINAANCHVEWRFTGYNRTAGSWDAASYALTKAGVPLVIFGTDNPDSSVYALNARTGKEVWRFQCYNPGNADDDVAAGAAITAPGVNGFAQGVAYVTNKADRAYALQLNNGDLLWETNFAPQSEGGVARSTPAIDGTNVVFGFSQGLFDLNALNGSVNWEYIDPTHSESIAAPAIAGTNGTAIAITADVGGSLDVVSMVGATQLYTDSLGSYDTASVALSGSNLLVATSGGELYDFVPGGGNDVTPPSALITSPTTGTLLANPNGNLTISGTASDPVGVAAVEVAVQSNGTGGTWWDEASLSWSPGPVDALAQLGSPDATSSLWSFSFPVPRGGGTYSVTAYAVSVSGQSSPPAYVEFAVNYSTTGPYLAVSNSFVAPGGAFNVSGGGFGASEKVEIDVHGKTLATADTTSTGVLPSTRVVLSGNTAFGQTSVTATGMTSGATASAAITVTNNWDQMGYGPGRVDFEPDDQLLDSYIFPGSGQWIDVAWHFDDDGVPMNASPAIVDGVVYAADTAGQLFALASYNGGLLWTFTLASGAAIDGSPAVDAGLGLVIFGANDGTVDAVYLANGTLAWSASLGGDLRAPDLSGDTLYVTTSSGTVAALSAANGSVLWSVKESSGIGGAPSFNSSAALLVVGETNGEILGLNAGTGATRWTYATSGAIESAALIDGGTVYVGSMNGDLYALNQANGNLLWSYATGGGIAVAPSLGVKDLFVGSDNGKFFVIKLDDHRLRFSDDFGSPVVGIASVAGVEVIETANGYVHAAKTIIHSGTWSFETAAGLASSPVILDGAVFVAAGDGNLYAFTPAGQPPQ